MIHLYDRDPKRERNLSQHTEGFQTVIAYECDATAAYGMGERFDGVDRMQKCTKCAVIEKFTQQGEFTYFPLPFFFCNDGHGVFVDTGYTVTFVLSPGHVEIHVSTEDCDVYFLHGTSRDMIAAFVRMTGEPVLPPKWAFGPWISANRWNRQADAEEQLRLLGEYAYPATVMVLEAWSDEATFYIWNGATYAERRGEEAPAAADFTFHEPWPDPKGLIDALHGAGLRLILWQIPALKKLEEGETCLQHEADSAYAIERKLLVKNADGTPYEIPRQWFIGAHVPDFTNAETCAWWMKKRQYLLDMGVDGFKTDGGEFIHDLNVQFSNGLDGHAMRNLYPTYYEKAYAEAVGTARVLFSRAGGLGGQTTPIHWAGDQVSTFAELRAVLGAGLSLGLSGVPFWGFDIAGFAGEMPSAELYLRATALAAFAPVMQWHSETLGGQYGGADTGAVNDRSPWNMEKCVGTLDVLRVSRLYARLRMNLLPELYRQARIAVLTRGPMMRHLVYDYPYDAAACACHDEFMLGDLLIAPILTEGGNGREVYLPSGDWYSFLHGKMLSGGGMVGVSAQPAQIPVFMRSPGAVALNLPADLRVGGDVGNQTDRNEHVVFCVAGDVKCDLPDDLRDAQTIGVEELDLSAWR